MLGKVLEVRRRPRRTHGADAILIRQPVAELKNLHGVAILSKGGFEPEAQSALDGNEAAGYGFAYNPPYELCPVRALLVIVSPPP